jgi:hypothetical protein
MSNIARKSRLAQNLDFMRRKFPKVSRSHPCQANTSSITKPTKRCYTTFRAQDFTFYPRSFVLPQEVSAFREQFDKKGKAKRTFIIKPDAGCQGRGIYLSRKVSEVDTTQSCVAQHYISKPLLIEGKKFDLRIYVLVASCKVSRFEEYEEHITP